MIQIWTLIFMSKLVRVNLSDIMLDYFTVDSKEKLVLIRTTKLRKTFKLKCDCVMEKKACGFSKDTANQCTSIHE